LNIEQEIQSMKIQSDLHAGMSLSQCEASRNYWKGLVKSGTCVANPYPPYPTTPPTTTYPPTYPTYPTYPTTGGGYVNGVYYADMSGTCG
jgi:hypothetical protein